MWMPQKKSNAVFQFTQSQIAGRVDYLERQAAPQGGFGGQPREILLFRVETADGQIVNCRFEGTRNGPMDMGDEVQVIGWSARGVLQATQIADKMGSPIASSGFGACFVATVVYEDPAASEVERLRAFRDEVLRQHVAGRAFIDFYNQIGPLLARSLAPYPSARQVIRCLLLDPICRLLPLPATARETARPLEGRSGAKLRSGPAWRNAEAGEQADDGFFE